METLVIEWRRPAQAGEEPVASSIRVSVGTPEEASRVWDVLVQIVRLLTAGRPAAGNGR